MDETRNTQKAASERSDEASLGAPSAALLARIDALVAPLARGVDLATLVRQASELYTRDRPEIEARSSDPRVLAARLAFYLPRDMPKIVGPLGELRELGLVPDRPLRVLDVGAGLGATSLGLVTYLRRTGFSHRIDVLAIDRDARALELMEKLAREDLGDTHVVTKVGDLRAARGVFDLVLAGFVLNELGEGEGAIAATVSAIEALGQRLADGGSLIVLEPALRETTRRLHAVRDALAGGALHVFAPCVHEAKCPMLGSPRDWCHEDRAYALPPAIAALAREAGLRFERLTYAYLTLRRDVRSLGELAPYRVVSQALVTKGKRELFVCGAGGRVRIARMDRDAVPGDDVERATRGALVSLSGEVTGERVRVGKEVHLRVVKPAR